jgi:hypothetical protein
MLSALTGRSMFKQEQPRFAMAIHLSYDKWMMAGGYAHWDGLFQFGAPNVVEPEIEPDPCWMIEGKNQYCS